MQVFYVVARFGMVSVDNTHSQKPKFGFGLAIIAIFPLHACV